MPSILVVDDEPSICKLLCLLLSEAGYSVTCATCPMEARALYRAQAFDLVIADICLPKYSGEKLIEHLREEFCDVRAILMSGHPGEVEATATRGYTVVAKPFCEDTFLETVVAVLANTLASDANGQHDEGDGAHDGESRPTALICTCRAKEESSCNEP